MDIVLSFSFLYKKIIKNLDISIFLVIFVIKLINYG